MKKSLVLATAFALMIAEGASAKPKEEPVHQRGWIGGEYRVVTEFPAAFSNAPKVAILVTRLSTNTPASLGGINEGDLLLELNHAPIKKLTALRRSIDASQPGTLLPIKLWRDGEVLEREVRVGRETYTHNGIFAFGVPGFFHAVKLWPFSIGTSGLSVGVAGFKPEPQDHRKELSSAEETYFKKCDPKNYQAVDSGWTAWLVVFQAETTKRIRAQEVVPQTTSVPEQKTAEKGLVER